MADKPNRSRNPRRSSTFDVCLLLRAHAEAAGGPLALIRSGDQIVLDGIGQVLLLRDLRVNLPLVYWMAAGSVPSAIAGVWFLDYLKRDSGNILETIRESKEFSDETESALRKAYDSFLDQFETSEGESIKPGTEAKADPVKDEELEQEQIVKQKKG